MNWLLLLAGCICISAVAGGSEYDEIEDGPSRIMADYYYSDLYEVVDYTSPIRNDSLTYDRCKITHRCNRAWAHYDVQEATYQFTTQKFKNGLHNPADWFFDFEEWRAGTVGWSLDQAYLAGHVSQTAGAHFNSFDLDLLGPLEVNHSCSLVFSTTNITVEYSGPAPSPFASGDYILDGLFTTTDGGQEVAVFNFDSIYLGPEVEISVVGNRAFVLMSRSTIMLDTAIVIEPGTVGVCLVVLFFSTLIALKRPHFTDAIFS